jgi:hypothetical protein
MDGYIKMDKSIDRQRQIDMQIKRQIERGRYRWMDG